VEEMKIEVLIILSEDMIGGTETNLLRVVTNSNSTNIKYDVCFLSEPGSLTQEFVNSKINTYHLNFRGNNWWEVSKNLYKILKSSSHDFIYPFGLRISFLSRLINLFAGNSKVIGSHRSVTIKRNCLIDLFERITSPLVIAYIANTQAGCLQLAKLGIPASKLFTIYNGIDPLTWRKNSKRVARESLNIPINTVVITCVANLKPLKGHQYLINACEILKKKHPDFLVLFVGGCIFESQTEKQIVSQIHSSGLDNTIRLLGARSDVAVILDASDIFVLPSLWEGLPNVILEAMAKSLPVVATNVGGISEVILNDGTGFLVPSKNAQELAYAIGKLMDDPEMRERFGYAGRKRLEEKFSLNAEIDEMDKFFQSLKSLSQSAFRDKPRSAAKNDE